jgi:hypothetical protein
MCNDVPNTVHDGFTDDRTAIQDAIDAASAAGGGEICLGPGVYLVSQTPFKFYCLNIPSNVTMRGSGKSATTLLQAAPIAGSVRLLNLSGSDIVLRDLCLDGNKANQTVDEHRAGIWSQNTQRLVVTDVLARNFTGDGCTIFDNTTDACFTGFDSFSNNRDGIAFTADGAVCEGLRFVNCRFLGNAAQQIDSEPAVPINNVAFFGCKADGLGVSQDYVVTTPGKNNTVRNKGWSFVGCTLNGPIEIIFCDGLSILGCSGVNPTTKPSLDFHHRSVSAKVIGCTFSMTQTTVDRAGIVSIFGEANGDAAEAVLISGNRFDVKGAATAFGIYLDGCISATVENNVFDGPGRGGNIGIGCHVRATSADNFLWALIHKNSFKNFAAMGLQVIGNNTAQIGHLDVSENIFHDTVGAMPVGMSLNADGSNAVQSATIIGNKCMGGVTTPIATWPHCPVLIGGAVQGAAIYSIVGTPLNVLVANAGSIATRRDGGKGTTFYVKESSNGSLNWAPK